MMDAKTNIRAPTSHLRNKMVLILWNFPVPHVFSGPWRVREKRGSAHFYPGRGDALIGNREVNLSIGNRCSFQRRTPCWGPSQGRFYESGKWTIANVEHCFI